MTTETPIKPQTVAADVRDNEGRLRVVVFASHPHEDHMTGIALLRMLRYSQHAALAPSAPDLSGTLIRWEWGAPEPPPARSDRMARLRKLARWSTTEAELDWQHLEQIDKTGWGAST